jgi:hypothetical protein
MRASLHGPTIALVLWVVSSPAVAQDAQRPNAFALTVGGQIDFAEYKTGMMLGGSYARWLGGITWLDLGSSVIVHKESNIAVDAGVRWKFAATASKVRAFLRAQAEVAILLQKQATRVAVGARGGGGAGYYWTPGFGATLEAGAVIGPAFGGGVHFAGALDILLGFEFVF